MSKDYNINIISIIKYAGAYIAFIIGSGYATGQEIMQFFTSFGLWGSIGAALISMMLFAWMGSAIMTTGYDHKEKDTAEIYTYFFGKKFGIFLDWFITLFLFAVVVIMISGTGATLSEYYGLNYYTGCILMAALVLVAFLFGLRKLIDIVGLIGSVIIVFTLLVGFIIVLRNADNLAISSQVLQRVKMPQAAGHWIISGILYAAYPLVGAIPFFSTMGASANSRKEALYGGIAGGAVLMSATIVMNLALLSDIENIYQRAVPTLFLAESISPIIAIIFSVVLLLGIFSTAAPMFWSVLNKITKKDSKNGKITAVVAIVIAFFCGLLPFGTLVGTIYPYTGYLGIIVLICIGYRQFTAGVPQNQ